MAPIALDGLRVGVAASIGISVSPGDGCTGSKELSRSADVAYAAKRSNVAVCAYDRRSDANDRGQIALIEELRTAIAEQQLVLHFQPTLDCSTMTIRGVEALVRWPHPTRGLLYPDSFIPLAEQVELTSLLTRSVLQLAISEARRFRDLGRDSPADERQRQSPRSPRRHAQRTISTLSCEQHGVAAEELTPRSPSRASAWTVLNVSPEPSLRAPYSAASASRSTTSVSATRRCRNTSSRNSDRRAEDRQDVRARVPDRWSRASIVRSTIQLGREPQRRRRGSRDARGSWRHCENSVSTSCRAITSPSRSPRTSFSSTSKDGRCGRSRVAHRPDGRNTRRGPRSVCPVDRTAGDGRH